MLGQVRLARMVLLSGALAVSACQPAGEAPSGEEQAPSGEPVAASDEEMIRAVTEEFAAAWSDADANAMAQFFAGAGDIVDLAGKVFSGREAIKERYTNLLAAEFKGTTLSITTTSIRFLQPDVAVWDGSYEITGMKAPSGEDMPPAKGLDTILLVKQDGRWLISSARLMAPVKPAGTT